jgi:hypothetical protein
VIWPDRCREHIITVQPHLERTLHREKNSCVIGRGTISELALRSHFESRRVA